VAESLVQATAVYFVEKDYPKAEPYLLRALNIDEALYGKDSFALLNPLAPLCALYDQWGKADKSVSYYEQALGILEKQYGGSSPVLVTPLTREAQALHSLGRADDAAKVETRVASIRAATMKTN
jgi:tetratricopeptide (TPR) repeat protein